LYRCSLKTDLKKIDRIITPAEVRAWFGKSKQQKLKPEVYGKIAAGLTNLRWPSDPPPKARSRSPVSESCLWDIKAAGKDAKALLASIPVMLSHFREPKWSPEHQEAYKAIDALNQTLHAAMPYIEWPLGRYEPSKGKKAPKNWHMHSFLIARLVIDTFLEAGHKAPGITHNSIVVTIIKNALVRMQFPYSKTVSREAIGAHLKRWHEKYGSLALRRTDDLVTK
jgi:hypothetical protein